MLLVLTDRDPDYGADFLTHGFCALLGGQQVVDWPRKPGLHWKTDPEFDCNVDLDTTIMSQDAIEAALRDRAFDLIVVPTMRGAIPQQLYYRRAMWKLNADRIVYYDAEDHALDTRPIFYQMAGVEPAAYFKRELPIGERWAVPLPFGYPEERVMPHRGEGRQHSFVYTAHLWDWCGPESLRRRLYEALRKERGAITTSAICTRLSVATNHQFNRQALAAVSPAGQGYGTNRHNEVVADGCCLVVESPWRQWPEAYIDGTEAIYFRDEISAVDAVRDLLADPARAFAIAKAGQAKLLARHTTRHRAATIWESIHAAKMQQVE